MTNKNQQILVLTKKILANLIIILCLRIALFFKRGILFPHRA